MVRKVWRATTYISNVYLRPKQRPYTIRDLYRIRGKAELVDGRIVLILPHVGYVGYAVTEIKLNLIAYAEQKHLGYPFGSTVAFEVDLQHRKAFCPDIGFVPSPVEMS